MDTQRYPYLDGEIVLSNRTSRGYVQLHVFPALKGSGEFSFGLQIRVKGEFSSDEYQLELTKNTGISIAKAKFFLRTFRKGSVYTVDLDDEFEDPYDSGLDSEQVVQKIGNPLARLYSSGTVAQLEIAGIAHELGVDPSLVWSAISRMRSAGTLEVASGGRGVMLTPLGAITFDAKSAGLDTAIQSVTASIAGRLNSLKSGLGRELSSLQNVASRIELSEIGLNGYGHQVRTYFTEITDIIYDATGFSDESSSDTTDEKIFTIAKLSGSETKTGRIVALSRSLDKTAFGFNESVLSSTTKRSVEINLLMVYVVLVLSELLDAANI